MRSPHGERERARRSHSPSEESAVADEASAVADRLPAPAPVPRRSSSPTVVQLVRRVDRLLDRGPTASRVAAARQSPRRSSGSSQLAPDGALLCSRSAVADDGHSAKLERTSPSPVTQRRSRSRGATSDPLAPSSRARMKREQLSPSQDSAVADRDSAVADDSRERDGPRFRGRSPSPPADRQATSAVAAVQQHYFNFVCNLSIVSSAAREDDVLGMLSNCTSHVTVVVFELPLATASSLQTMLRGAARNGAVENRFMRDVLDYFHIHELSSDVFVLVHQSRILSFSKNFDQHQRLKETAVAASQRGPQLRASFHVFPVVSWSSQDTVVVAVLNTPPSTTELPSEFLQMMDSEIRRQRVHLVMGVFGDGAVTAENLDVLRCSCGFQPMCLPEWHERGSEYEVEDLMCSGYPSYIIPLAATVVTVPGCKEAPKHAKPFSLQVVSPHSSSSERFQSGRTTRLHGPTGRRTSSPHFLASRQPFIISLTCSGVFR